ncbi:hypothetical protein BJ508DRAFT_416232 [Ascobolus immersus RN42]|uniref:BZIP domain-containing protein n=1 Tax=Ascobolus immersus RN42 TaxID=1160509 RepID=A0A3N4HYU1_ASCIM|nr:hypothetical protein BJ508DRAFT_416232 [Ascobolus immersus RN42]
MTGQPGTKRPNTAPQHEQTAIRLRENQRRSRARKKEYIASLEERLRNCQKMGVEANIELQNAARKVLFENYRLKELLRIKNVDEDEIDAFLQAAPETGDGPYEVERNLQPRPCSGLGGECCQPGDGCDVGSENRQPSITTNLLPTATTVDQPPAPPHQSLQSHTHHQYAPPTQPQVQQLQNIQPRPYAPLRLRVPSPGSEGSTMMSPATNSPMPYTPSSTASMQSPVQEQAFVHNPHGVSMMAASHQPYPPLQNLHIAALQADQIPLPPSATSEFFPQQSFQHHQQQRDDSTYANQVQHQQEPYSPPPPSQPATGATNCGVAFSLINQFMPGKSQTEIDIVTSRICPPDCCSDKGMGQGADRASRDITGIAIPTSDQWDIQANQQGGSIQKLDSCEVDNNTLFEVLDSLG